MNIFFFRKVVINILCLLITEWFNRHWRKQILSVIIRRIVDDDDGRPVGETFGFCFCKKFFKLNNFFEVSELERCSALPSHPIPATFPPIVMMHISFYSRSFIESLNYPICLSTAQTISSRTIENSIKYILISHVDGIMRINWFEWFARQQ